jgi:hypothetical protein
MTGAIRSELTSPLFAQAKGTGVVGRDRADATVTTNFGLVISWLRSADSGCGFRLAA